MNIDSCSVIGKLHKGFFCEDYVRHGISNRPYMLVSDGCSSSADTDIGSRIILCCAEKILKSKDVSESYVSNVLAYEVMLEAKKIVSSLSLDQSCLDATLLVAVYFAETKSIIYSICGDGYVFWKNKGEEPVISKIEYAENAPYYPIILIEQEHYYRWRKEYPENKLVVTQGNVVSKREPEVVSCVLSTNNLEYFGLSTDGLGSFSNISTGVVPDETIFKELLDFRSYAGSFVQRSLNFLIKGLAKQGTTNGDDITVAAFYCFD